MHDRKIVLSGVALTMARNNRYDLEVMGEVMDELEQLMIAGGYLKNAPFKWIGLTLRYGLKNEDEPHYQGIDKQDGELALAIELDTHELREASREELKNRFIAATLKAIIHAGNKYDLPTKALQQRLDAVLAEIRASALI